MTVDYGLWCADKQQLQNSVDAAALAGAGVLRQGLDFAGAKQAVLDYAAANPVGGYHCIWRTRT